MDVYQASFHSYKKLYFLKWLKKFLKKFLRFEFMRKPMLAISSIVTVVRGVRLWEHFLLLRRDARRQGRIIEYKQREGKANIGSSHPEMFLPKKPKKKRLRKCLRADAKLANQERPKFLLNGLFYKGETQSKIPMHVSLYISECVKELVHYGDVTLLLSKRQASAFPVHAEKEAHLRIVQLASITSYGFIGFFFHLVLLPFFLAYLSHKEKILYGRPYSFFWQLTAGHFPLGFTLPATPPLISTVHESSLFHNGHEFSRKIRARFLAKLLLRLEPRQPKQGFYAQEKVNIKTHTIVSFSSAVKDLLLREGANLKTTKVGIHLLPYAPPPINDNFKKIPKETKARQGSLEYIHNNRKLIPKQYILYYSMRKEPSENIFTLLQAYHRLPIEVKQEYPLVCVGHSWSALAKVCEKIQKNKDRLHFCLIETVSKYELALLYRNAKFLVFPAVENESTAPLIQAMFYGVPVLASRLRNLEDIAGNAALFFERESVRSLTTCMHEMLSDTLLETILIKRGKERSKQYSGRLHVKAILQSAMLCGERIK